MKKLKVTVVREVTETWEYIIDADGLELPNADNATPAEFGNACDMINDVIHGMHLDRRISDELIESDIHEESIDGWKEVTDAGDNIPPEDLYNQAHKGN